ncbi:MAG TPA: dihydrolipoyl dehydrogenase [Candidatus Binataceae bacterium]|nr:dihydrolipoyl dehydrogenase [Candidatus Binataceae bacterium]
MSATVDVDVICIGAGGGAYPAAFRLAGAGRKVVMVDPKGVMSGNCLAEGCVPSKAVREAAALWNRAQRFARFGIQRKPAVDYGEVVAHKDAVQRLRYAQHEEELKALGGRLELVKGVARFLDLRRLKVEGPNIDREYRAQQIIIASGADVALPPIPGAKDCLTSRSIFKLNPSVRSLPDTLLVVGGGYVGLETASFFRSFGSRVHVLEMTDQLLPGFDPRMVGELERLLDPEITITLKAKVEAVERTARGFKIWYRHDGRQKSAESEQVLLAVGRTPVIPEGCERVGLELEGGAIKADEAERTNLPGIYACGDVNNQSPLFHAAVRQSLVAAANILAGRAVDHFDRGSVPFTVFTLPAAAFVGIVPASASPLGVKLIEAAASLSEDSRAQILDETGGEVRLFFSPGNLRLIGAWVVGLDAENLISEIGLAVARGLTARDLAEFPGQHPMASESIAKAARSVL